MLTHLKLDFDWKTVMNLLSYTSISKKNIEKRNYSGLELLHLINSTSITYLDDIQSLINALFMLQTSFTVGLADAIMSEDLQEEVNQIIQSKTSDINSTVSELLMEKIDLSWLKDQDINMYREVIESNQYNLTKEELEGLTDDYLKERLNSNGSYTISLKYPDIIPLMDYCKNRDTRKKMCIEFKRRCINENTELAEKAFVLRNEMASIFGFEK
jgi:hypothetical protein